MIKVYMNQEAGRHVVTVVGHAEDDRVCAGVSALYVALVETAQREGSLDRYLPGGKAQRAYIWRTKPMRAHIQMFRQGVEAIAREYPEHAAVE
jgi:uncharacterized protein YsxB (DUF464 family)